MSIRRWWNRQNLNRKVVVLFAALSCVVVTIAEVLLEPIAGTLLLQASGGYRPWHEIILWAVSITIPSLVGGYIFAKWLTNKLDSMTAAADRLARGDFAARIDMDEPSADALGKLRVSFNNMASALENLMNNERRLLSDISHELRSPLARMSIALELLPMKEGAARDALLGRLEKEISVMSQLIKLLLEQSRARLSSEEKSLINISDILAEVADDISFQGQVYRKDVVSRIAEGAYVLGYEGQCRTLLFNVASNALFYTPEETSILMQLERNENRITLTIRDYGSGVPEDQLQNIFRAFYRVDDSRTRSSGGAGLGLALAREAVERIGGTISAKNANPGLEVTMTFPAAAPA